MDSGFILAISLAIITCVAGFYAGVETGRLQILSNDYTCEQDINDKWQCKGNK